jgi:hypothetical protein
VNPLEPYLNRATRGIWGRKKLEVIAELRGSIEARAWKLECQGFTPERALETALRELGEPKAIAAGLRKVHTMPTMFKNTLALGMFAALSLTVLNSSRAQIEVTNATTFTITAPGYNVIVTGSTETYFLKISSIKKSLEDTGIAVNETLQKSIDPSPYDTRVVPTLIFRFPGSDRNMLLQSTPVFADSITVNPETTARAGLAVVSKEEYISLTGFVRQLKQRSGLPVRILGWHNPVIEVGQTRLGIGTAHVSATPRGIYVTAAGRAAQNGFPQLTAWLGSPSGHGHALRLSDPPGTVFAVVTPSPSISSMQSIAVSRVADDGVLYFTAASKVLEFVEKPLEVVKDRVNITKKGYGSSSHPAKALLIRISPELKTTFELPARIRSAALK